CNGAEILTIDAVTISAIDRASIHNYNVTAILDSNGGFFAGNIRIVGDGGRANDVEDLDRPGVSIVLPLRVNQPIIGNGDIASLARNVDGIVAITVYHFVVRGDAAVRPDINDDVVQGAFVVGVKIERVRIITTEQAAMYIHGHVCGTERL